jgi:hypothetical protein
MNTMLAGALMAGAFLGMPTPATAYEEPTLDPSQLEIVSPAPVVRAMNAASARNRERNSNRAAGSLLAPPLKVFPYTVTSPRDGLSYSGTIVGTDPRNNGARTTAVELVVIPLRIQLTGTVRTWDATVPDSGCLPQGGGGLSALQQVLASPLVNAVSNLTINGQNVGNVDFIDGFQRAQFWRTANGAAPLVQNKPAYHLALSPITVKPVQTITTANNASGNGASFAFAGGCGANASNAVNPGTRYAAMNINFIDVQLQNIITNLGLNTSQFPLFVAYGMFMTDGAPGSLSGNCCILGYHNSTTGNVANPGQTYGIATYFPNSTAVGIFGNTTDVATLTHEILEWVNDPSINNIVPAWGHIGQVSSCQNNLETGDPLSGTMHPGVTMPNGVTYNMQENAFFGWFLGDVAFQGAGGRYSSNGTFSGAAKACPPGGTN